MAGIYMITNKLTYEAYVGSATDIKKRWSTHLTYLRQGTYKYETLQNAFDNEVIGWVVLEECTVDEKLEREEYWFDMAKRMGYVVLNKREKATTHTVKDRTRMRLAQGGNNNGNCKLSLETVEEVLFLKDMGWKPRHIAEKYNLTRQYICTIGKEKWKNVDGRRKPEWFKEGDVM